MTYKVSVQVDGEWVDLKGVKPLKDIKMTMNGTVESFSPLPLIGPMLTHASPRAISYQASQVS